MLPLACLIEHLCEHLVNLSGLALDLLLPRHVRFHLVDDNVRGVVFLQAGLLQEAWLLAS